MRALSQVLVLRNVELRVARRPSALRPTRRDLWYIVGTGASVLVDSAGAPPHGARSPVETAEPPIFMGLLDGVPDVGRGYRRVVGCTRWLRSGSHCATSGRNSTRPRGCWPDGPCNSSNGPEPVAFAGGAVRPLNWPPESGPPRAPVVGLTPTPDWLQPSSSRSNGATRSCWGKAADSKGCTRPWPGSPNPARPSRRRCGVKYVKRSGWRSATFATSAANHGRSLTP